MRRTMLIVLAVAFAWLALSEDVYSQRGGRGGGGRGGGGRGGGFGGRPGGGYAPQRGGYSPPRPAVVPSAPRPSAPQAGGARPGAAAVGPYSGRPSQVPSRGASGTGPRGGSWQTFRPKSGSITTKGGSTIDYKGAAVGGTTGGGVSGGRYVGGVQVTTPGGRTIDRVGSGKAVTGPGDRTVAGKSNITKATGPGGTAVGASRSGVAVGPDRAVAGRSGVAVGPHGAVAGRSGVAAGPGGVAAGSRRVAATAHGTYYRSAAAITGQGVAVRRGFAHYDCFRPRWYARYPGAWLAAGFAAGAAWSAASWGTVSSACDYPAEPVYYDYGSTAVVEDNTMYVNAEPVGTTEQYAEQATAIADAGEKAKPAEDDKWMSLGVFAMVQGEETTAYNLFQLAVNKDGVLRGNYYNALTDSAEPVAGSVDRKTQRAAWTVGNRKSPVYEAGIANLTREETTMLVHYGKDKTQQLTLIRIEEPKDGQPAQP